MTIKPPSLGLPLLIGSVRNLRPEWANFFSQLADQAAATAGADAVSAPAPLPGVMMESGSTNITNADTVVGIDTETLDDDANYSIASSSVTVVAAGTYVMGYSIPVNDDGTAGATRGRVFAWLEKDAGTGTWAAIPQSRAQCYHRTTSEGSGVAASFIAKLIAGEAVRLVVRASSTVDCSTEAGHTQLSMHRIKV